MGRSKSSRRSGEAVAAQHRRAGPMRHRLDPRGNARSQARAQVWDDFVEEEEDTMTNQDDVDAFLAEALKAEMLGQPVNPLAEWMLSDAWRTVPVGPLPLVAVVAGEIEVPSCDRACGAVMHMTVGYHRADCALSVRLGRQARHW